jgi:hypothetical protein
MKKKTKVPDVSQYTVRMRLEYVTTVTVEASSENEANAKAQDCQWVDDGMNTAELINWDRASGAVIE